MGCRNNRSAPLEGEVEKNPRKPKKGARWRDTLKQDFGQLNEDWLYDTLAPIEVALCGKEITSLKDSILLYDLTSTK